MFFSGSDRSFYILRWWIESDCLPLFEYRILLVFVGGDGTARARCHARGKRMLRVVCHKLHKCNRVSRTAWPAS